MAPRITLPGEPAWEAERATFNSLDDQRPAAIAVASDADDVVAAVRYAADQGWAIAPQRTGHGATAMGPIDDALLLKTTGLRDVHIDAGARTARVGAGALWSDVVGRTSEHGLAALHVFSPEVGVVGYTLGGGHGWYGRAHGLASSSLTAADVVLADGTVVRADAESEPELRWALRGGGGNFGVVTAIEFDLVPVPALYAGTLFFPWERADEVLHAWHAWTADAPEEATSVGRLVSLPPIDALPAELRGRSFATIEVAWLGSEADAAERLAPLRALGPEIDTFATMAPAGIARMHMDPDRPQPARSGHLALGTLPSTAIDAWIAAAGPESGTTLTSVELRHTGGALARPADAALPSLPGEFLLFAAGVPQPPNDQAAIEQSMTRVREALQPHAVGVLLSFVEEPFDAAGGYPADAWERLRSVRARYDPDGRMRANHAVPASVAHPT
jgi:FAD/FMN-containing dehydrogenase